MKEPESTGYYRGSVRRFSEWKEHDGVTCPPKCVGYKKNTCKEWYFREIIERQRLKKLPAKDKRNAPG